MSTLGKVNKPQSGFITRPSRGQVLRQHLIHRFLDQLRDQSLYALLYFFDHLFRQRVLVWVGAGENISDASLVLPGQSRRPQSLIDQHSFSQQGNGVGCVWFGCHSVHPVNAKSWRFKG